MNLLLSLFALIIIALSIGLLIMVYAPSGESFIHLLIKVKPGDEFVKTNSDPFLDVDKIKIIEVKRGLDRNRWVKYIQYSHHKNCYVNYPESDPLYRLIEKGWRKVRN